MLYGGNPAAVRAGCFDGLSKHDILVTGNFHTQLINSRTQEQWAFSAAE